MTHPEVPAILIHMIEKPKSRQGKTKGATSFITVSGAALANMPSVVISRKWAEAAGIFTKPSKIEPELTETHDPLPTLQFSIKD